MRKKIVVALLAVAVVAGLAPVHQALLRAEDTKPPASGGPYPNDAGPNAIDVSKYPPEYQETYKVFKAKCATCHSVARPLNAQFLQLSPAEQEKARKEDPDLFKDKKVVDVDDAVWSRYVKRMMSKPGSTVGQDGKRIFELMVYDSKQRKMGVNAVAWRGHRKSLLEAFKKQYAEVYATLFGKDEPAQPAKGETK